MPNKRKRALLIFARKPVPGMVKTRLVPMLSPDQAARLYDCMLADVLARTAVDPQFDRFLFYEDVYGAKDYFGRMAGIISLPQQGKDLGERMLAAFRAVLALEYTVAVVIGSDAPDLPTHFIVRAFDVLESGACEVVFGPCEDGGYYLLGMKSLYPALFRNVPWSSDKVLVVSLERAKVGGIEACLLPVWHDVDKAADLERPDLLDERNGARCTREFLTKLKMT